MDFKWTKCKMFKSLKIILYEREREGERAPIYRFSNFT